MPSSANITAISGPATPEMYEWKLIGRPTSSSIISQAFLLALTCFLVTMIPPIPWLVPSSNESMCDCPAVLITIKWSAPCQAAIRILLISSSNLPEAISVVITQSG